MNSAALDPKLVTTCQFHDIDKMTPNSKGEYLEKVKEGEVKIKTYIVREVRGIVYAWIHSMEAKPYCD